MSELSNFKNTQEIIKKHNFSIQKKYGQNFLIDEHVLNKIIAAAELTEDDYVIEIGPGIGTMTERMAPECRHVTAIEIDKELIPILSETLSGFDNVDIINEDVLKVDLNKLIAERNDNKPVKVVANLPYYITTPIIMSLLENKIPIDTITVMVQKEVADRMMVGPGTKDYGALSLAVQYYAKPYIVANVPMNCFIPRPNVASAVIRLTCHKEPPVTVKDENLMFNLIRASFNQRRKTLINGISNFSGLSFTKEQVAMALNSIGLSENIRGEALDLEKFAKLSDALLET
ncbi:MAG: 16S rRNA (adenine(1518)-N(6)/adenine(1519)-N(6))-dimethyltransferase RsmA [Lachnospiraceae bacterium]|nr:16S rRNA (adenine(1518)-N(6)/adenine(1519)-N(6))-dimethyltransferase RsmA [Lachnospiraceae bacterium]